MAYGAHFKPILPSARGCSLCHFPGMSLAAPSAGSTSLWPQTHLWWKEIYQQVCSYPEWSGYSPGLCKMDKFVLCFSLSFFSLLLIFLESLICPQVDFHTIGRKFACSINSPYTTFHGCSQLGYVEAKTV